VRTALKSVFSQLILPIAVLVIAGAIMLRTATITEPSAYNFFTNYFSQVTRKADRPFLYKTYLTPLFRSHEGVGWSSYTIFWNGERSVIVDDVSAQNSSEFEVELTFYPTHGQPINETVDYWLVCNGFVPSFVARIPILGCPWNALQFDSGTLVSARARD
jgi:hypothetical protein